MKIKFKNGSTVETIDTDSNSVTRGIRSNFITAPCYDTLQNEWVMMTLDMREPMDRYIPEWFLKINELN